ncbi:MAG TPA: extensin family protein [Nannocystaceae bacterium]|nr:extensin family protein [Nannocystaceae bacterium]
MGARAWSLSFVIALGCGGTAASAAPDEPAAAPTIAAAVAPTVVEPAPIEPAAIADAPVELPPTKSYGHADLDPLNDLQIGPPAPLPDCEERLATAGVTFKPARIGTSRKIDGVPTCGAEQVVRFKRGPGEIAYSSAPLLTCTMALALADFEQVVQEEAEQTLGSRVVKIEHLGTFNCRKMALYDLISEHSYANGIDIRRLVLADGRVVDVLKHFRPEATDAPDVRGTFLRKLSNRLFDEQVFSNVVTPYFDSAHRNHIHVDLGRYRVDGSRPQ